MPGPPFSAPAPRGAAGDAGVPGGLASGIIAPGRGTDAPRSHSARAGGPAGGKSMTGSGRPLKIGVQLPEVEYVASWPEIRTMAQRAEVLGYDSLWVGDHLLYRNPGDRS